MNTHMQTKNYDTLFGSSPAVHSFDTGHRRFWNFNRKCEREQDETSRETYSNHTSTSYIIIRYVIITLSLSSHKKTQKQNKLKQISDVSRIRISTIFLLRVRRGTYCSTTSQIQRNPLKTYTGKAWILRK